MAIAITEQSDQHLDAVKSSVIDSTLLNPHEADLTCSTCFLILSYTSFCVRSKTAIKLLCYLLDY